MFRSLSLALLLTTIPTAALANPICYMDRSDGVRVDLSYMCGDNESATPSPQIAYLETTSTFAGGGEALPVMNIGNVASMSLWDAEYYPLAGDTVIKGTIEFTRSAIVDTIVEPYIVANGTRLTYEPTIRQRGQRRYGVSFRVPGNVSLYDFGFSYGLSNKTQGQLAIDLGRSVAP